MNGKEERIISREKFYSFWKENFFLIQHSFYLAPFYFRLIFLIRFNRVFKLIFLFNGIFYYKVFYIDSLDVINWLDFY